MKERLQRHANGEELNDLFQPLIGNIKGEESSVLFKDQVAEVEQAGELSSSSKTVMMLADHRKLEREPMGRVFPSR